MRKHLKSLKRDVKAHKRLTFFFQNGDLAILLRLDYITFKRLKAIKEAKYHLGIAQNRLENGEITCNFVPISYIYRWYRRNMNWA